MFKSEKGDTYVNWVIIILVVLIFSAIIIRVLVGENGLINQRKEDKIRNETENNIVIELTNGTKFDY
ncbi:MAG TPA: hypothetical protein OIM49_04495 [Clostridiaceae bacterium]|mgnify:FL=1|jgi:hypothetical protein|nr:hypothetical protein [Clostridiaceae bacterium]